MSKNNKKKSTNIFGNLQKSIAIQLTKACKVIRDTLSEYGLAKNQVEIIAVSIQESAIAVLKERYIFVDNFVDVTKKGKKLYGDLAGSYLDFLNWTWIALSVPFYHSFGDTLGYYNGNWEFNYNDISTGPKYVNELIYDFISLGGVNDISIRNWKASDDTIMYISTMQVLSETLDDTKSFGEKVKKAYLDDIHLIEDRHPGQTTMISLEMQQDIDWNKLPYNSKAIGAGAAMRTGCIGIFYLGEHNRQKLIELSVDSSRITHNSAIAILGGIVSALFTAYALERVPINLWPHKLLELLKTDIIDKYIINTSTEDYSSKFLRDKDLFTEKWQTYVNKFLPGAVPKLDDRFMKNLELRYKYLSDNFSKGCDIPFSCGDDCLIMAYDSVLRSGGVLEKLIFHSILHPGDSDTVGAIAFSWFGGYYHSPRLEALVGDKFDDLEFFETLYEFFEKNVTKMVKIYYYDMFLNVARQYLVKYAPDLE